MRLRRDQHDFDICAAVLIDKARGGQGAPHAGEAGSDYQNALGHFDAP
jgi:hypothetical protein